MCDKKDTETSTYNNLPHMYHTWIESSYDIHHIERSDQYLVKRVRMRGEKIMDTKDTHDMHSCIQQQPTYNSSKFH